MTSKRTAATPDPSLLDWVARISAGLTQRRIRHALVGGIALAAHGFVRATTDIDIVVPDVSSLQVLRAALTDLGLLNASKSPTKFRRVQILRALIPQGAELVVLDVVFAPPAMASSLVARQVTAQIAGEQVPIVGVDDLVLLKLLRDSPQDRIDIDRLREVAKLDRRYLRRLARELGIESRLDARLARTRRKRS